MTIKDYRGFELTATRETPDDVLCIAVRNSDYWILAESHECGSVSDGLMGLKMTVDEFYEFPERFDEIENLTKPIT